LGLGAVGLASLTTGLYHMYTGTIFASVFGRISVPHRLRSSNPPFL